MSTTSTTANAVPKLEPQGKKREVGESLSRMAGRRLKRDKLTLAAIGLLAFITILCLLAQPISSALNVSYSKTNASITFLTPSLTPYIGADGVPQFHILGTDDLGRDHLSRLLFGGQVSLAVGFLAAILSLSIGVSLGIICGYYGGLIDDGTNWIISTLNSIPSLFLLLIIAAVLQPSPTTLILVLGLIGWTGTTRLVRGETLSLREREFVVSARAIGASPFRIMLSHILPNLFSVIVITLAIDIGALILTEAGLSFLGLGIKEPFPSWGNMLVKSQEYFTLGPYLVIMPGLMIFLTVLCLYVIGDGIRDAFDPTAKD
ncbi:MAG: putative oligopeptide ABC transporter permease [Chloroflexi bacterium OLB15]|nr:MAG: putative oligopeptide ABC transporter permease [Chloroflexi bacterium OLB15]